MDKRLPPTPLDNTPWKPEISGGSVRLFISLMECWFVSCSTLIMFKWLFRVVYVSRYSISRIQVHWLLTSEPSEPFSAEVDLLLAGYEGRYHSLVQGMRGVRLPAAREGSRRY